jgi:hypothetical protein
MKKGLFFHCFIILSQLLVGQSSLSFFHNTAYKNPAGYNQTVFLIDINTVSYYNKLPLAIYDFNAFAQYRQKQGLGINLGFSNKLLGKAQQITEAQFVLNYHTLINFKQHLTFGAGTILAENLIDESRLTTDFDKVDFTYSYGTDKVNQNTILIPLGVSLSNEKMTLGSYYLIGLGQNARYGIYGQMVSKQGKMKQIQFINKTGLVFLQEFVNPQVQVSDQFEIDNYKFNVFAGYQLAANTNKNINLGLGAHYHWRIYDLSYQFSVNTNKGLGLNHQIGLQCYW